MTAVIAVLGAALLFSAFGLLNRYGGPRRRCATCPHRSTGTSCSYEECSTDKPNPSAEPDGQPGSLSRQGHHLYRRS